MTRERHERRVGMWRFRLAGRGDSVCDYESERRIGDSEKPDIPIVSGTLVFPVSRVY